MFREGSSNILNSFEEGLVILDERTRAVLFSNKSAQFLNLFLGLPSQSGVK